MSGVPALDLRVDRFGERRLIGGKWDEPKLIGLAYAWERATKLRRPPTFRPTVPESAKSGIPKVTSSEDAERRLRQLTESTTIERRTLQPTR